MERLKRMAGEECGRDAVVRVQERRRISVSEDQISILLALAKNPCKPPVSQICRMARMLFAKCGLPDCSVSTLRRHLKRMERVHDCCSRVGIPEVLIADNGPGFCKKCGMQEARDE